ncbi:MAG: cell division protein SepF [Defluviitaleaceae bacterium]|nr:cell division protein SepF [Defluviitaleaceae bacterium]
MAALFGKLKNMLLGVEDEYDDEDDYYDDDDIYEQPKRTTRQQDIIRPVGGSGTGRASNKEPRGGSSTIAPISHTNTQRGGYIQRPNQNTVTDVYGKSHAQVNVHLPRNIEDARDIIENTRSNIISVVNLEEVDSSTAQRIADFLSGSVDALDATIRRLSYDMFIIAPLGVEITGELQADISEELKGRGGSGISWLSYK